MQKYVCRTANRTMHNHTEDIVVRHKEPVDIALLGITVAARRQSYYQGPRIVPEQAFDVPGTTLYGVAFSEHIRANKRAECYGLHLDVVISGIPAMPKAMPTVRLQPL